MPLPAWHPHFDVWVLVFVLGFGYWFANTRIRRRVAPAMEPPTGRQWWQWYGALAVLALVSGWPFHDIAESSLFTLHMIEHMALGYVLPPLLLMATPRWMADATIGHPKVARILRPISRAVPAFAIFNSVFVVIHWPEAVTLMVGGEPAHFGVHALVFAAGGLMWMPVLSPTLAIPKLSRPTQMLYLFLQSLLPTIPASFLTFSSVPLYPIYADAALQWGVTAVTDQTVAGIVMKLGGGVLLWSTIAVIWFRWTSEEREWEHLDSSLPAG